MPVFNMKEGTLQDREKLLESSDPEKAAEEKGIELEKFDDIEELTDYLQSNFDNDVRNSRKLAEIAALHLKPAVDGHERRILYPEIDE